MNELSVDTQLEREVAIVQAVRERDPEFLVALNVTHHRQVFFSEGGNAHLAGLARHKGSH